MKNTNLTLALSVVTYGEAVRLNRGKSQGEGFDFKHMKGPASTISPSGIYPYVSSQCFKKFWREMLPGPFSPVTRGKNAAGKEKNQVYTNGNPIDYLDDDLFGYMIAGANEESDERTAEEENTEVASPEQVDDEVGDLLFTEHDVVDSKELAKIFKGGKDEISRALKSHLSEDLKGLLESTDGKADASADLVAGLISALNRAIQNPEDAGIKLKTAQLKAINTGKSTSAETVRAMLVVLFKKALTEKRLTTKRTAPIRMHALVAFSGVKTAQDFQTFSRDIAYTGKNSILNPNPVGIYSAWMKTRILIEGHRIGKFYIGENRDILDKQAEGNIVQEEPDPYTRPVRQVPYIALDPVDRMVRIQQALTALANIGNRQGPASGALHDGSLRPKGFVGAFMRCADSPFDAIWQGTGGIPIFDLRKLKDIISDWEDLFMTRRIYIGWPVEMDRDADAFKLDVELHCKATNFEFVVKTPRQALMQMAADLPSEE